MKVDEKTIELITKIVTDALGNSEASPAGGGSSQEELLLKKYHPYTQACPVHFGNGAIRITGYKAKELGITKAMIVTDEGLVKAGHLDTLKKALDESGVDYTVFDKVKPNPYDTTCEECGALARQLNVDGFIALGGGSVMDTAKAANILINNPPPLEQWYFRWDYNPGLPAILIPTTAGTGSESTVFGVVSNHETHIKKEVMARGTLAIIDPELTYTMPRQMISITAFDAFSHAAEGMTTNVSCEKTDLMSLQAIRLISKWLSVAYANPEDKEARYQLALACNWAGQAFSDTLCHLGHATAHGAGGQLGIDHGIFCAWALPETMAFSAEAVPGKVRAIADAMGIVYNKYVSDKEIGQIVANSLRQFMQRMGIPSIADSMTKEQIVNCWEAVRADVCWPFLPKEMNIEETKSFLARVYDTNVW